MPEPQCPLDYANPQTRPPPRDYGGCLLPLGIIVGCIGLAVFTLRWNSGHPYRQEELIRFAIFVAIAIILIFG